MKTLTILAIFFSINACSSQKTTVLEQENQDQEITSKTELTLEMGQLKMFGGTTLQLEAVKNDSRCPTGVECIWAGEVTAVVGFYEEGNQTKNLEITFSPKKVSENNPMLLFEDGDFNYYAVNLSPYPKEGAKVDGEDYSITLVKKAK